MDDTELRDILRATAKKASLPSVMPQTMRRKITLRRARTIGVMSLMTAMIAVGGLLGSRAIYFDQATPERTAGQPGNEQQKVGNTFGGYVRDVTPELPPPDVPYFIDLNTREMTPLPKSITQSLATGWKFGRFAASPDGSRLAYVGVGNDGTRQIFIANLDGTGIRQVTDHPPGALWPAWSPDGTKIAYVGNKSSFRGNLFLLDVATGVATKVTDDMAWGPQFTPDGSSLLYTSVSVEAGVEAAMPKIVSATGGKGRPLFDLQARGLGYAGSASLSPDGALVTFMGNRIGGPGALRFVANADGTDWRIVDSCIGTPAGTWSPDGGRIVCGPNGPPSGIRVIDVGTGESSRVADGRSAIWLDDHTLLVQV
jgi:Tol biopolymer transport system component